MEVIDCTNIVQLSHENKIKTQRTKITGPEERVEISVSKVVILLKLFKCTIFNKNYEPSKEKGGYNLCTGGISK